MLRFLLGPNAFAQPLLSRQSRGRTVQDLHEAGQFLKQTCLTSDRFVFIPFQSTRPSQDLDGMTTIPARCGCHLHTRVLPCIHASLLLLRCFWGSVARATLPPLLQLRNLPNWMVKRYFAVATSHGYNLKNWRKSSVSWVANVWFCLVIRIFLSRCFMLFNQKPMSLTNHLTGP